MVAKSAITGGAFAFILVVLQIVSVVTPNWFVLIKSGNSTLKLGLFYVCLSETTCSVYEDYMLKADGNSSLYIVFVGLNLLGCVLSIASLFVCIAHIISVNPLPERSFLHRLASVWLFSGGFTSAGVIWVYFAEVDRRDLNAAVSVEIGWSFYLLCFAGGCYLIAALSLSIVVLRMPPTIMTAGFVDTDGTLVSVTKSDSIGYPTVAAMGFPHVKNKGYLQNVYNRILTHFFNRITKK